MKLPFGIHSVPSKHGKKWTGRKGWFFLGLGSEIYLFHLSLGRVAICIEASRERY